MIRSCNVTSAASRLVERLRENPNGIPVRVGWDGQQITVFAGTYASPAKSLPNERVEILPGWQLDEIETALALAIAHIRVPLQRALKSRPAVRAPRHGHHWRRGAVDQRSGRD